MEEQSSIEEVMPENWKREICRITTLIGKNLKSTSKELRR